MPTKKATKRADQAQKPTRGRAQAKEKRDGVPVQPVTLGQYLIRRLYELGVRHIFGVPGDYVLTFYKMLEDSPITVVGTTREDCAGLAADAYARLRGLGVVCVTYGVGGFNLCNAVAQAYAEESPVVVISGAPGVGERATNAFLHHRVGEFTTQKEVFEKITVASTILDDRLTAFREIDRVLEACIRYKRPVYIELPRDQVNAEPLYEHKPATERLTSDRRALREAVEETVQLLRAAQRPVVLVGVEIHRFGLHDELMQFVERANIAMASTLLGKSAVAESHPLHIGIYEGKMCRDEVRQFVENSDCILLLGCFLTDVDLGGELTRFPDDRSICATSEGIRIRHHVYRDVLLADYMRALARYEELPRKEDTEHPTVNRPQPFVAKPTQRITIRRLYQKLNDILTENIVVICDIGDALFAASELVTKQRTEFISPAYYTSMGFAVPAAVGACFARPELRPLCIVGDGAFQMTGMELSTIVRHGFNPIVIVLNNCGYTTERYILDGAFNDIHCWEYHRIPEVLNGGWGFEVRTEGELEDALQAALANTSSFSLLNVHLDPWDCSAALERLGKRLQKRVRG